MPRRTRYRIRPPRANRASKNFTAELNSWLIRECYSVLRAGTAADADSLESLCWSRLDSYLIADYDAFMGGGSLKASPGRVTTTQAVQIVTSVVSFALENYDPEEFSRIQRARARKRRKFTVEMLGKHTGLSISKTAELLRCSPSTVSRLRRAYAATPLGWLGRLLQAGRSRKVRSPWTALPKRPTAYQALLDDLIHPVPTFGFARDALLTG